MKALQDPQKGDRRQTAGAAYVEFLIAFMPLFVFFMSLVQLAYVEAASLVVKHAAVMATRAAIVVLPDDPAHYGDDINMAVGKRLADIQSAARSPLRAAMPSPSFEVSLPNGEKVERDGLVEVQVDLNYRCLVPIGRSVVCDPFTGRKKLSGRAAMPNQGAAYEYGSEE